VRVRVRLRAYWGCQEILGTGPRAHALQQSGLGRSRSQSARRTGRAGLSRIQPRVQLTRACGPARVLGSGKDEKIQAPGRVLGSAKALTMRLTTDTA
jgi:hypothetical protein